MLLSQDKQNEYQNLLGDSFLIVPKGIIVVLNWVSTGNSFSEALILDSTNPQYDERLFIELQVQYIKIPSSEHAKNMLCT